MLTELQSQSLHELFLSIPAIKLVYLFGCQATGNTGPMSDYDFAVYTEPSELQPSHQGEFPSATIGYLQSMLIGKLGSILKTNAVDVVMLNQADMPELEYAIIAEGKLLYEIEPYKVTLEPVIMAKFFDF